MAADPPQLIVRDAAAWRTWLAENVDERAGVWLVLAKKGTTDPTSLSYAAALEGALCHGWIDGQARRRDEGTYVQRFTPRRRRSMWSQRNVGIVERLTAEAACILRACPRWRGPRPTGAGRRRTPDPPPQRSPRT